MRPYIRQFFWGSVIFALLMVFTNFTHFSSRPEITPVVGPTDQVLQNVVNTPAAINPEPGSRTTVIDGQTYVLIDGKWYPKAADSLYVINGEKIYFVDNFAPELRVVPPPQKTAAMPLRLNNDLFDSAKNPLGAYDARTIKQMMDTLQDAKVRMKERDDALKSLSTAD
jgi:hypothetical protein